MKIAIMNGPNLNFLGIREPMIYGDKTLEDLEKQLIDSTKHIKELELVFFQSNHEGAIVDFIQQCYHNKVNGIVINPGAFAHYSYAITDAIKSVSIPTIEVHISNIYQREAFRQHSVTAPSCVGMISGLGMHGYTLAVDALIHRV